MNQLIKKLINNKSSILKYYYAYVPEVIKNVLLVIFNPYRYRLRKSVIKLLELTFAPWKDKTVIINKYVTNIDGGRDISFDSYFSNRIINFIKADIEGAEIKFLEGAENVIANNEHLKIAICTYHKENDFINIVDVLKKNEF
jgi:hypothetical protein